MRVAVHDDGPGVPESLQPNVFERFARGDDARVRAGGSTGSGPVDRRRGQQGPRRSRRAREPPRRHDLQPAPARRPLTDRAPSDRAPRFVHDGRGCGPRDLPPTWASAHQRPRGHRRRTAPARRWGMDTMTLTTRATPARGDAHPPAAGGSTPPDQRPPAARAAVPVGCSDSGAVPTPTRPGPARRCSACCSSRRALHVEPHLERLRELVLLRRGPGRQRRAGRRSSSAAPTPPTRSPSTSRRPRSG